MEIILTYFSDFTSKQLEQFRSLKELYRDWNEKINLISRKDIDSLYEKHVLHSLSIAAVYDFEPGTAIIDIGTGGGFPGIPLAIFFPETKFHLVDSIAKKIKVVDSIITSIELKNVTTQNIRAEEIKNRKFDFVVSRAVAPLKDLWTWSKPLLSRELGVGSRERHPEPVEGSGVGSRERRPEPVEGSGEGSGERRPELVEGSGVGNRQKHTTPKPGLISLKGGDLAKEIQESGTRPRIIEIAEVFPEEFFKEKYLLFISR